MKKARANVHNRDTDYLLDYLIFPTNVFQRYGWKRDIECQCNFTSIPTDYRSPKREEIVYYSGIPTQPKQVYAYSRVRSFTDIGVGSVLLQQKKRVRKIYLPETENRGVGSNDLASFVKADKRLRQHREEHPRYAREEYVRYSRDDFYIPKKTSSKCVGGALDTIKQCSEKLSPIINVQSRGTNPHEIPEFKSIRKDTGNNTIDKPLTNITIQVESIKEHNVKTSSGHTKSGKEIEPVEIIQSSRSPVKKTHVVDNVNSVKSPIKKLQDSILQKSSDSLEQHVHNLEDPSFVPSSGSSDPMENKIEKEYRRMFSHKRDDKEKSGKPIYDLKSTSLLRRRFEALRRGIAKKEESKKKDNTANITEAKETNPAVESSGIVQNSVIVESSGIGQNGGIVESSGTTPGSFIDQKKCSPTRVDISVESDPPSLEARSYSQTKLFSPAPSSCTRKTRNVSQKKPHVTKKDKESLNWPPAGKKVDNSDVEGMFKIWGEKFNLEDSKQTPHGVSFEKTPKEVGIKIKDDEPTTESQEKKEGKRFFFFKRKSKDKTKSPCKSKKGITTGRCEVNNCPILKGPTQPEPVNDYPKEISSEFLKKSEELEEIVKKKWLQKFIQRTIESRKSLQIRWNNKMYTTSSSTVFELMDNVYRQAEVIIRSQSETSTVPSSYQRSHHVNFVQDVEAWMVSKLERDVPINFFRRNDYHNGVKDRKWFIDKSKAFAHKIELVLHSKNFMKRHGPESSQYITIDIPKGFFSDVSSESGRFETSNSEEVYKIIEYESPESRSEIKSKKKKDIGDYFSGIEKKLSKKVSVRDIGTDTKIIETLKKPLIHRDVVIQGSKVQIPKRCDVIEVGIITQRDMRDLRRPILKIDDDISEEESEHTIEKTIKQCELAESYLREYYRHWMPLGIDLFPSCASDVYMKNDTEDSSSSINNQGDCTKSCPNLKDYNSTRNLDPPSSHSYQYKDPNDKSNIITTFKSLTQSEPPLETKRILPKDSFEVLKKRKLYACSNKSKWRDTDDEPYSVPSLQDKGEQDAMNESPAQVKSRKKCMKRVSITQCDYPSDDSLTSHLPLQDMKPLPGILSFAGKSCSSNTKHATIGDDVCDIMPQPCKEFCETTSKTPSCSKPPPKQPKPSKKTSSETSSSSNMKSGPTSPKQFVCSCTCSPDCSITLLPNESPQNTNTTPPPAKTTTNTCPSDSTAPRPCTCDPNRLKKIKVPKVPSTKPCTCAPKVKKKSIDICPQKSPTDTPEKSPTSSQSNPMSPNCISPKTSPTSDTSKLSSLTSSRCSKKANKPKLTPCPAQNKKPEAECACKSVGNCPSRPTPTCSKCFQKSHSQSSNTEYLQDKSNQPSQESPLSLISPRSMPSDPNLTCPGFPIDSLACKARLEDLAKKAKSLPKMQGLHLKMKPAPNPPKCRSDCPKFPEKGKSKENNNEKGQNSLSNDEQHLRASLDEKMLIRIKKETCSNVDIREGLNMKIQDADGTTLYERRDYKADHQRELHSPSVLGEMYKVNRLVTEDNENKPFKEDAEESSKSDASIANLIEITFGLKVTQGDKITEINLKGEQEERDLIKSRYKECKPGVDGSQNIFMTTGETEPTLDDSGDKNDINIKIVIKNFKSKAEKSFENRNNDEFSRKISQKFHTVSTGYSDIITNNINNIYSIHRNTVDLTTSKSQHAKDVSVYTENNEMKTNIQDLIPKEAIEAVDDEKEKTKKGGSAESKLETKLIEVMQVQSDSTKNVDKTEIDLIPKEAIEAVGDEKEKAKKDELAESKLETELIELMQVQSDSIKIVDKTEIVEQVCKCIPGEINKFNFEDFVKKDSPVKIQITDSYEALPTEEITEEKNKNDDTILNEMIRKSEDKVQKSESHDQKPDTEHHNSVEAFKKPDNEIKKSVGKIIKADEENAATISYNEINNIVQISQILNKKWEIDKNKDEKHSDIDCKVQNTENNKYTIKNSEVNITESNEIKLNTELTSGSGEEIHNNDSDAIESRTHSIINMITANDIITKSELVKSILERVDKMKNYVVVQRRHSRNEDIKRVKEMDQIIRGTENNEPAPRKSNEAEEVRISKIMLISELNKSQSDRGERLDITKNTAPAFENKIDIEKIDTNITIELKFDVGERIQTIETYEDISKTDLKESITNMNTENDKSIARVETCETVLKTESGENKRETTNDDILIPENKQVIDFVTEEFKDKTILDRPNKSKNAKTTVKQTFNNKIADEIKNFENFLQLQKQFQYPTDFKKHDELTPDINIATNANKESDINEDERNIAMQVNNQHVECSQTRLSITDTDENDNIIDHGNTSDDVYDETIEIRKPHTRREKKEMLKHVFEKATSQKSKKKGRMKYFRNMLKLILASDSSEVEEVAEPSKVRDVTYSNFDPNCFKVTDSMNNFYKTDDATPSDIESKEDGNYPTQENSEDSKYHLTSTHSSDCQTNVSKCICNTMAERIKKGGDTIFTGCCCRSLPKIHEQTSCNIVNDLYLVNYKAAEYIDVQTQNSINNTTVTNVMVMKKMESVMTSKTSSELEKFKVNSVVSPYKDDKECEARNAKTNTVLGLLDDSKIVIRTSGESKMSLQTEIVIGWNGKEKRKQKKRETKHFARPADILQSYETKKAVLQIYTKKTVSEDGEKLVAKLPEYLIDKEEEIEANYVKNILLIHDNI